MCLALISERGGMGIAPNILVLTLMLTCYCRQQVFSSLGFFFSSSFPPSPLYSAVSPIENSSLAQASCRDCGSNHNHLTHSASCIVDQGSLLESLIRVDATVMWKLLLAVLWELHTFNHQVTEASPPIIYIKTDLLFICYISTAVLGQGWSLGFLVTLATAYPAHSSCTCYH